MSKRVSALLGLLLPAVAQAEVKVATPAGFESENRVVIAAAPAEVYATLGRIGTWWSSSHTYSGQASNLRMGLKAGDCFCETWGSGTIEHGRVIYAKPGEQLRVSGALGPLQAEAVMGTLTWTLKPVAGGTELTQRYVVGGYVSGGAEKYAKIVDQVLAQQLAGLAKSLAK